MSRVILANKKTRLLVFLSAAALLVGGLYVGYLWYQGQQASKMTSGVTKPVADKKLFSQFAAIDNSEMSKEYYNLINLNKKDEALDAVKRVIGNESDQSKREQLLGVFEAASGAIDRQDDAKVIGAWVAEKYPSPILLLQVAEVFAKSSDYSRAINYAEQAATLAASRGDEEQRAMAQEKVGAYRTMVGSVDTDRSGNSRGQRVPNE